MPPPPFEGKPTDDNLLLIREMLLPILMEIHYDQLGGIHSLTAILTDAVRYPANHGGNTFICCTHLPLYDSTIMDNATTVVRIYVESAHKARLGLVGKSAWNSTEFCNYSNSGPFELQNFHRTSIFLIIKFVPTNLYHVPTSLESSPAINSSNFMHRKTFPLYVSVASGIKILDSTHQRFLHAPSPITLMLSTRHTNL